MMFNLTRSTQLLPWYASIIPKKVWLRLIGLMPRATQQPVTGTLTCAANMPCDLVPNIPKAAAYMLAGRILILTTSGTCICMYIGFPETGADCSTSFGISTCSNWSKWIASTPLLSSHLMANVLEIRIPYPPTGMHIPAAAQRIGLVVAKMEGTTEHGHRHAYGQRVKATKDPLIIKAALHHRSLESQLVYTESHIAEVTQKLADAALILDSGQSTHSSFDITSYGFENVDPLRLLSGPRPKLRKGK